jgi:predicted nucleic acid-binding protein
MKYLLDTNVLSELKKPKSEKRVVNFINSLSSEEVFISCISIGEIKHGITICKDKNKAKDLDLWFEKYLISELKNQIINIDPEIMREWGSLVAKIKNLPILDSLIAATCLAYKLHLVTRNIKDFEKINELKIINPWNL